MEILRSELLVRNLKLFSIPGHPIFGYPAVNVMMLLVGFTEVITVLFPPLTNKTSLFFKFNTVQALCKAMFQMML